MTKTLVEIEQEIAKRKKEIEDFERQVKILKEETPEQNLARELHSMLCTHNHTEGCSWFYETKQGMDDWTGYAHGEYLGKATRLDRWCYKNGVDTADALSLLRLIQ
jgi:hypothetical protein